MKQLKRVSIIALSSVLVWGSACRSPRYQVMAMQGGRVEMTSAYDADPDAEAVAILAPFKAKVDSVMSPVIGESAQDMVADRPESLLSNLVADVLRLSADAYPGMKADVGLMNVGGLRTSLAKGPVTYGDIYQILPFENTLCVVSLTGDRLRQLFENIAAVDGEGISGARIVISGKKLLEATVNGRPIDDGRVYKVATIDYLAEGNDGMTALKFATDKFQPEGATLRQLFLDYVAKLHKQGRKVTSRLDGRITVK